MRHLLRTSARNSSESTEMSGFSRPAAAKMSVTPSDATAREMYLAHRQVQLLLRARVSVAVLLGKRRPHRLEEPHIVTNAHRLRVGHGQRESLRQLPHRVQAALLAVLLGQAHAPEPRAAGSSVPGKCL